MTSGDETGSGAWLNPRLLSCPCCDTQLFAVDHSPFHDEWYLYCDSCACRAEVSYYDPIVGVIEAPTFEERCALIERALRPCDCGGAFLFSAPRRCPSCRTVVIDGTTGVDLWPGVGAMLPDERDPTPVELRIFAEFEESFIRRKDLWRTVD